MVRHGNNMITVQPANQIPGGDGPGTGRSSTPSANVDDDHDVQDISDHPRSSFSSDATPRPTPVPSYPLIAQDSYTSQGSISDSVHLSPAAKRLAFFTDKLAAATHSQSHSPSRASPVPFHSVHLPPRSHSRADSGPWDSSAMASASSTSNLKQVHTSPSKSTTGRTYDSRLVSREMHRLGNLSHLPTHLPASLTAAASVSTLALPTTTSSSIIPNTSSERDNPWGSLHVHILPLFNGEPLRVPIEDLNTLVKRHIQTVVSLSPSKALSTLENDTSELIASGMVTLNAKFMNIEENKLLARVVDMWGFFWDQVLPYVEGALLPLQTDPLLASLHRNPKTHRTSSPTRQAPGCKPSISHNSSLNISALGSSSHSHIDVRTVGLRGFRDQIIYPLFQRLYARLSMPNRLLDNEGYLEPRCNQMLLVLAFQTRQPSPPPSFSLTSPTPPPQVSPGEKALTELIRVLRLPCSSTAAAGSRSNSTNKHPDSSVRVRAPSFLSGGLPRDRRGRIAQKRNLGGIGYGVGVGAGAGGEEGEEGDDGGETPRNGFVENLKMLDLDREREREFLESLRSPDPITSSAGVGARASVGGWGLGGGGVGDEEEEDGGKAAVEEDEYTEEEDEPLTWDEAQLMVENVIIYSSTNKMPRVQQEDHAGANAILGIKKDRAPTTPTKPGSSRRMT